MLQHVETPDGIIGFRLSERISHEEMEVIAASIACSAKMRPETNLYVEVIGTSTNQPFFANLVPRALSQIENVEKLGRIAIVSDDFWLGWSTQLQNALLPVARYELFSTTERERAFTWLQGRISEPQATPIGHPVSSSRLPGMS